ncbi:MAG TPA: phosphotransferase [Anaerolineales bacterium]|nr:phosphotransferase [Anaerolineales bacterium]
MLNEFSLPWHDPAWMKQAHEWIHAEMSRRSIQVTGDIEQPHLYPWSTVLHVPTNEGKLFFKATAPETMFEVPLTYRLAEWFPDRMPELVGVDLERGWMLMRDGGVQLRQSIRPTQDIHPWKPVIRLFSELQAGAAEHVEELLAIGVPDYRLPILPDLYRQLLTDEKSLMISQEKGLTTTDWQILKGMATRFEQICGNLAAYGIPESINHGDFHDGNILVRDGRIAIIDWADACLSHPFMSLRTFFVSIEIALKLDDYVFTPEMAALLDYYLEAWQDYGSIEHLRSAYQVSRPVASIVKAVNWHLTISNIRDETLRAEYAWIVPELFREFLYHESRLEERY